MSEELEYTAKAEADTALAELADELDTELDGGADAPPPPEPATDDGPPAKTKRLTADDDAAPVETPTEPVAEAETPPEPEPDPAADVVDWTFRAYGQEMTIPGAKYKPGHGAFIPEESLALARQAFARASKYERVQQERDQLKQAVSARELEAQAVLEVLGPLLTPDKLTEAALNPDLTLKELKLAIKERQLTLEREMGGRLLRPEASADDELYEQVQEQIDGTLAEIVSAPDVKAVLASRKDIAPQVLQAARRAAQAFYVPAPFDHPRGAFKKGELVLDSYEFAQHVRAMVAPYASAPAPKAQAPAPSSPPPKAVTAPPAPGRPTRTAATTTAPSAPRAKAPPTKQQIRDELDAALRELAQ